MITQTMLGAGIGPYFTPIKCIVYNRTGSAVALGDVLMLDHLAAETESSKSIAPNTDIGGDSAQLTSCWPLGNAVVPITSGIGVAGAVSATTGDPGAIFGVVTSLMQGAGADNTKVELTLYGVVTAAFAASTNFGVDLYPATTPSPVKTLTATLPAALGTRCLAKSLAPDSTSTAGLVLFNGLGSPGCPIYAS